jgi:hypothetical protein
VIHDDATVVTDQTTPCTRSKKQREKNTERETKREKQREAVQLKSSQCPVVKGLMKHDKEFKHRKNKQNMQAPEPCA